MKCRKLLNLNGKTMDLTVPVVMAIINITPDSFFSGSRKNSEKDIYERVLAVIKSGAGVIDIGGYSSRPGAEDISDQEEYLRVRKGFSMIREIDKDIPVSVDTFRSGIVKKLYEEFGGFIVNDISAGELDKKMIPTVGRLGLPYIAMHMKGNPQTMQQNCEYRNVKNEVINYFAHKITAFYQSGIKDVIIDPGFGFSKNVEQNFQLLSDLSDFKILGLPVLTGVSRKSMIWKPLGIEPENALNGTTALHWECLRQGASFLRVHDVPEAMEVIKLYCKFKECNGI